MTKQPHVIVRLKDIGRFLPLGRTQRDEIIKAGHLKTVPLTPGGRAKGVTLQSMMEYQLTRMGLEPLDDDGPDRTNTE
jgi:hypothetical protein